MKLSLADLGQGTKLCCNADGSRKRINSKLSVRCMRDVIDAIIHVNACDVEHFLLDAQTSKAQFLWIPLKNCDCSPSTVLFSNTWCSPFEVPLNGNPHRFFLSQVGSGKANLAKCAIVTFWDNITNKQKLINEYRTYLCQIFIYCWYVDFIGELFPVYMMFAEICHCVPYRISDPCFNIKTRALRALHVRAKQNVVWRWHET